MQTIIVLPENLQPDQTPRAYCLTDYGEVWGPLWPYAPVSLLSGYVPPRQHNKDGLTLEQIGNKINPGSPMEYPVLHAGQYYPRMCRESETILVRGSCVPRIDHTPFFNSFIASLQQVESLFDNLSSLFRVAHPEQDNLNAYGGAIRDLIILACTEVEAQWKGILKANNFLVRDDRYSTKNYVLLLPAMQLDSYRVALIRYPALPELVPFAGWNDGKPTQSLGWYDTYNKVKHDRETNFKDATLENAIKAVAASVVMLAAQFGYEALGQYHFNNLFRFTDIPRWDPKHWYYGPIPQMEWKAVNYPM